VEIGSGVAILPEPTLSAELRNKSLVAISIRNDSEPLVRPLAIIHRKNRALSPVGRRFLKRLLEDSGANPTPSRIPELAAPAKAVSAEKPLIGTEVNGRVM
jgi:DNA-binding transcriptional LysR family regulator